jgi:hypothetical protein
MSDSSNKQSLKKGLSHPLLLLVAGAIFTSLLFPYITRQWQTNEKQMEVKSELVDELNEAVANTLTSYRLSQGPYGANTTAKIIDSVVQWQISRNTIGSKLDLYFPSDSQIRSNWSDLSNAIEAMRGIAANSRGESGMCNRLGRVLEVQAVYSTHPLNIDPDVVEPLHCDRYSVPTLENSSHLKKVFPPKDGEINWNVATKDGEINWNAIFLRTYASNTTEEARAAQTEYNRSYNAIEKIINDDKDKLLAAVIASNIRAFE